MTGTIQQSNITSPEIVDRSGIAIKLTNGETNARLEQGQYVYLKPATSKQVLGVDTANMDKIIGTVFVAGNAGEEITIQTDFCRIIKAEIVAGSATINTGALLGISSFNASNGLNILRLPTTGQYAKFIALENGVAGDIIQFGELKTAVKA